MYRVDAGPISFKPGDVLTEFFSTREYFNAFLIKRDGGKVAGWYCNITYPTQISGRAIHWHDLYLDIIIDHRGAIHIKDEDELEASGIRTSDVDLYREILDARDRLLELIESAEYPFSYPDQ
jgi:protein associated with RNAse G/E